jgi:hypothetical protein
VHGEIPQSVKFKRNSAKCLSILKQVKLRKDNEIQVLKGKILSFGRRMNEISSGGVEALHDRRIWRRKVDVNPFKPFGLHRSGELGTIPTVRYTL